MSIPGLMLPGLNLASSSVSRPVDAAPSAPQPQSKITESLGPETEYRFESSFTRPITIKLTSGTAELFGTDLAPDVAYTFHGTKAAVYTWNGCELEVTGARDEDYVAGETPMYQYSNTHFALEDLRNQAEISTGTIGPRVLLVGPENAGKTALAKILTAYAVKQERRPVMVSLDPREGTLSIPGALTASAIATVLDIEEGWGSSPISGPSAMPVKTPLCYHFGCADAIQNSKLFKACVSRLGVAISGRYQDDAEIMASGCIIDTPGSLGTGKPGSYEILQHIVGEFSVNVILVLGAADKVFKELKSRFGNAQPPGHISVIRLDKSGGCVDRDESYMRELRQAQIREYFYGHGSMSLTPFTQVVDFHQIAIYRIADESSTSSGAFDPGAGAEDEEDDEYDPMSAITNTSGLHDRIPPTLALQNAVLAVTHADANANSDQIRDASVMCYVYVADVDDTKRRLKLLSPINGRIPSNALVWGQWPEGVSSLVA